MLVDGFNDLHGFRASVPDDGEFDGVMGFAVPVLHVSVKERCTALLTFLSQFRQFNVEEVEVGQPPWFAIGSSEIVVPCVRVGSLDRFGKHGDVACGASDVGEYEACPAFVDVDSELGRHGRLGSRRVVVGNMASICSFAIGSVSSSSVWRTLRTTYRMPANRLGTPTIARITPRPFHQSADSHSRISFMPINLTVPLEVSHAVSEA